MNNSTRIAALAATMLLATGLGTTAAQAAPASASASAKAKVLKQLSIAFVRDIEFGTVVAGTSASTIAIDASGTRTCGTGLTCSGSTTSAAFDVTGSNNTLVKVTAPAPFEVANLAGDKMTVTLAAPATMLLTSSGSSPTPLVFGATLAIGAGQAEGSYTAPFNITVDYN